MTKKQELQKMGKNLFNLSALVDQMNETEIQYASTMLRNRYNYLRSMANMRAGSSFRVGDDVYWDSNKRRNGRMRGQIVKINRTKAQVRTDTVVWNVPLGMLKKESK